MRNVYGYEIREQSPQLPTWAQDIEHHNNFLSALSFNAPPRSIQAAPAAFFKEDHPLFPVPPRPPVSTTMRRGDTSVRLSRQDPRLKRHLRHRRLNPVSRDSWRDQLQNSLSTVVNTSKQGVAYAQSVVQSPVFQQVQQVSGCAVSIGTGMVTGAVTRAMVKGQQDSQSARKWVEQQLSYYYPADTPEKEILTQAILLAAGSFGGGWGVLSGMFLGAGLGAQAGYQSYQADQGVWPSMKQAFWGSLAINNGY